MFYYVFPNMINKYHDELEAQSPFMRQAMLFRHYTEDIPLTVRDTDCIAGWYGYEDGTMRTDTQVKPFTHVAVMSDTQWQMRNLMTNDMKIMTGFNVAHTCIDYGKVVQYGLTYYIEAVDAALTEHPEDECLLAMKLSLEAACRYALRFAGVVQEKAKGTTDPKQKARLEKIYSALCCVPRLGARSFHEAVQSVWMMHSLIPMAEMSWASISIGRIDQYLYPFYQKHLADGGSVDEAREILKNLFLLLDSYGDGACAMNIGGMDAEGKDMMNDLSKLLIEVEKEMSLRAPIFAVRITPETPEDIFDSLIDFDLFKIGQPTFYGELSCRRAMTDRGVNPEEACAFSINSCMGLVVAGREFADMWGVKFNAHMPLELAINHGKPLNGHTDIKFETAPEDITDFESLMRQFGSYYAELIALCADMHEAISYEHAANLPDPFLSALIDGCIQKRQDRATGAAYNTVTVENMGLVNTCDALMAIKELVFDQRKYTLDDFKAAAVNNYEGFEALYWDILACKKYGMNDPEANALFKRMGNIVSAACKKVSSGNRYYLPSLHTIEANIQYGGELYATLDGRKQGEPVNKNANPSLLLQKRDHTSTILSAAAWDQTEFSGGQPIDLYFDRSWFESAESRGKIKALVRTYLQLGGLQFQVNSIDLELLKKAHEKPQDYPNVIVRKGGYSVRFNEMNYNMQEEFIEQASRLELCR
ncbi:MAG: hypothetical protein IJA85_10670 [Clostridia bacterium]|nr:hypothetical protein [Clostridia bacterium]